MKTIISYTFLLLTILILGCKNAPKIKNSDAHSDDIVYASSVEEANVARMNFDNIYDSLLLNLHDSISLRHCADLRQHLSSLTSCVNSLVTDLSLLDNENPASEQQVLSLLLEKKGDTLFALTTRIIDLSILLCSDQDAKNTIKTNTKGILSNGDKSQFVKTFFGHVSPAMATYILIDLKTNLYKNSSLSIGQRDKTYR